MTLDPVWLTAEIVRAIHAESVKMFGGPAGMRDDGLLESGLERPRNAHAYQSDRSLFELAAAYTMGPIKNNPFVDGNKRAGLLAANAFLALNGYDFRPKEDDIVSMITGAAAGEVDATALAEWFRENSRCVDQ